MQNVYKNGGILDDFTVINIQLISNCNRAPLDFPNILHLEIEGTLYIAQQFSQLLWHQRNRGEEGTVCPPELIV